MIRKPPKREVKCFQDALMSAEFNPRYTTNAFDMDVGIVTDITVEPFTDTFTVFPLDRFIVVDVALVLHESALVTSCVIP